MTGQPGRAPTAYELDLRTIDQDIVQLEAATGAVPGDVERATRLAYRRYHRASLAGDPGELVAVGDGVDAAIGRLGPGADLCLLKATIDLTLHRLTGARRDLAMAPGLAGSCQGRALLADLDFHEGRYDDARLGYEAAVRELPTWGNLARLAHLEATMGHDDEADQLYLEAEDELTAKEMRAYAWVELQRGRLDLDRGRYDGAGEHYRRADGAYSGYWLVEEHAAELLGAQGKLAQAAALYEQVIARVPRPELQHALGDLYAFAGKPDLARTWHERALAAYLRSARRGEVHYLHHLACFYADVRQDGARGVRWARDDLELRAGFPARATLAWCLYRQGRFEEARDAICTALSSGARNAALLQRAATIYRACGRAEKADDHLRRAASINPRHQDFRAHR